MSNRQFGTESIKNVRTLNLHFGRLTAIKWVRKWFGFDYTRAALAVDDIISLKPWTKPGVKPDLNTWELSGITPVRIPRLRSQP